MVADVVSMATSRSVRLPLLALLSAELVEVRLLRKGDISLPVIFQRLRFDFEDSSSADARSLLLPPPPPLLLLLSPPLLLLLPPPLPPLASSPFLPSSSFHAVRMIRPSVVCLL